MADMSLHVEVSTLAGALFVFEADAGSSAQDVKCRLAEQWEVPPVCQRLLLGPRALSDEEKLQLVWKEAEDYGPSNEPILRLGMIVSMEGAYTCLETCSSTHKRADAVDAIAQAATRDNDLAIGALVRALAKDSASEVRRAAVGALTRMAGGSGDEVVLAALYDCFALRPPPRTQRRRRRADGPDLSAPEGSWKERDAAVRRDVAEAVGHVALVGDGGAIASIFPCLIDCDEVQQAACLALHRIASESVGDETSVLGIDQQMKHRDERIRLAAQKALGEAARTRNHRAVAAAFAALVGDLYVVRRQAVLAFAQS